VNAITPSRNSTRRRRGLSLAEVLIAGAIVAMLLIAIAAAYDAMAQSVEVNDRFNRGAQIARIGVRRMVEEVRTAEAVQVGTPKQQSEASVIDATNLDIIQPSGRVVHYVYDADAKQVLYRIDDPDDPVEVVLARNVAAASFTADIEPHPDTGVRRTVRVVIELTMDVDGQTLYLCGSAVPRREMVY
jgi:hypothetical protein